MRYTGPKVRLARREGTNLFGTPSVQKILARRPGIPGMHGNKRMGKLTEYAKQLREKQKAKRIFGLSEKQFKKYFDKADRAKGITGVNLLHNLEKRLDNAIYRSGFALTRAQARQFASHGLFLLNGRRINVPSAEVRPGDVIEVRPSKKDSPIFKHNKEEQEHYTAPNWIKTDDKKLSFEVVGTPEPEDFEQVINPQMIVEFYSR